MARIGKKDHARILQMVDVENLKVAEVAAEYGCNPASIYALVGKLRRVARAQDPERGKASTSISSPATHAAGQQDRMESHEPKEAVVATDLFAVAAEIPSAAAPRVVPPALVPAPAAIAVRPPATITELPRKGPIAKGGGIGAALAKPGFGLTMRTADGDESMTPFRSLEDLLSAVKPILRASARSQDAVWFSIQKIDLSALEFDAA
jgi:transposase-like protein